MKIHLAIILAGIALALTACSFTLAADITPPPDYVPPTPMPTLGPLFPDSPPSLENGATLFVEHCAACHGSTGLGDGPQGIKLEGVTVPALALPEIARPFSPAQWYATVSQGNLQRYMPPFAGTLTDQERWDVVAYVFSLHTTTDEIALGKSLFEANCANCSTAFFSDQERMAGLSADELARIITKGNDQVTAFGAGLTDDELAAVADYLRTLTFAPPTPVTSTPELPSGTVQAAASPGAPSPAALAQRSGTVTGSVQIAGSNPLPEGLLVILHGYDHAPNQSGGPQEVLTLNGTPGADGRFSFENVATPENRIFLAEVEYQGVQYQSEFVAVKPGDTQISLDPVTLYEASTDLKLLQFGQIHIYSDFASQGTAQFLEIYTFSNPGRQAVIVPTDGTSVPFILLPDGAQNPGFEAGQDSAPFVGATDGIAILPSEKPYSLIAFFNLPYDKQLAISQPFALDAPSVLVLIPEGIKVQGGQLTPGEMQPVQGANFQTFHASNLRAGETLQITLSGRPKATPSGSGSSARQNVLIGLGAFGLVLVAAGAWLYLRDRAQYNDEEEEDKREFESTGEVMDAILALDDLHRAGKLADDVYQKRRAELKQILKEMGPE